MVVKKSEFSMRFIDDLLFNPRCDVCRREPCTVFMWFDQGCMEKLFWNEYKDDLDHFGIARVQKNAKDSNFLFCHLAGLHKKLSPDACDV